MVPLNLMIRFDMHRPFKGYGVPWNEIVQPCNIVDEFIFRPELILFVVVMYIDPFLRDA